jgi:[ribosomal protein S18]-alanine N-acetyltransferase
MSSPSALQTLDRIAAIDPPHVHVERMTLEHIAAVMEIEKTAFPRPWPEKAYRYELSENPNAYFVVARLLNAAPQPSRRHWLAQLLRPSAPHPIAPTTKIVGFAGMWMYVDEAHIATIATHSVWRGRRIGERILMNLMREAQRRNAALVTLEVRLSNIVAQNLYLKYGFDEVGRRKGYYQDNLEDALLMTVTHFNTDAYRRRLDELEAALQ